ncbi:MAG: AAA family ATPase, partial [Conexivisphaera sp.]
MGKAVAGIRIRGFKLFDELELGDLGMINVLVGRNNTGKTTIMEAVNAVLGEGGLEDLLRVDPLEEPRMYNILNARTRADEARVEITTGEGELLALALRRPTDEEIMSTLLELLVD